MLANLAKQVRDLFGGQFSPRFQIIRHFSPDFAGPFGRVQTRRLGEAQQRVSQGRRPEDACVKNGDWLNKVGRQSEVVIDAVLYGVPSHFLDGFMPAAIPFVSIVDQILQVNTPMTSYTVKRNLVLIEKPN